MRGKAILANFPKWHRDIIGMNDASSFAVSFLRGHYVHVPLMDHRADLLLAARPAGARSVSHRVAVAVAPADSGYCGGGCARTGEGDHFPAGAGAARTEAGVLAATWRAALTSAPTRNPEPCSSGFDCFWGLR